MRAVRLYLFSLAIRDETGTLAWITRDLARYGVNLRGFVADPAGVQLLVSDLNATIGALDALGFLYRITEVHEAALEDRPGALSELCQELAEHHINISMAFGIASDQCARIYLDVGVMAAAGPILAKYRRRPPAEDARDGNDASPPSPPRTP